MTPLIDSDGENLLRSITEKGEVWRDIVEYEGYYLVSNKGRVFSKLREEFVESRRTGGHYRKRGNYLCKSLVNKLGYEQIPLRKSGKTKLHTVHRLVAFAFLPNPDKEVNHINGIRHDNRLENLEWSNRRHNALHGTRVLGKNRGETNTKSKLTEKEVLEIKALLEKGFTQTEVSQNFDVTNGAIYRIQHGFNWSWLTGYDRKGGEQCL